MMRRLHCSLVCNDNIENHNDDNSSNTSDKNAYIQCQEGHKMESILHFS